MEENASTTNQSAVAPQQDNALFHSVFHASPIQTAILDVRGVIVAVNNAWVQFALKNGCYDVSQIGVGINYFSVSRFPSSEDSPNTEEMFEGLRAVLQGKQAYFECEYVFSTARGVSWYIMRVIALENHHGAMVMHEDITTHKLAHQQLELLLDRERELNALRSRFASITSHEFRTPLATISASTQLLKHYRDRLDPPRIEQHLDKIMSQIQYMLMLVDDVLTMGKVQSGNLDFKPEPVSLARFVQGIVAEMRLMATPRHHLSFHATPNLPEQHIDARLFRLVLVNLIQNALKYSPNGGTVLVEVRYDESGTTLIVQDEGMGIPEKDMGYLFEPFFRASNVLQLSGSGLGLSIVKQIVELHQGTINVSSTLDVGTRFIVHLP